MARKLTRQTEIRVVSLSEQQMFRHFARHGKRAKHEVASFLVWMIPGLAGYLPPKRKSWEPQHRYMMVFDAAALAVAYIASLANEDLFAGLPAV